MTMLLMAGVTKRGCWAVESYVLFPADLAEQVLLVTCIFKVIVPASSSYIGTYRWLHGGLLHKLHIFLLVPATTGRFLVTKSMFVLGWL